VTAALGFERDGETTIIFRKKMKADGFTDHDIVNEDMHVIWAVGQEPGQYHHIPKSGLEESPEGRCRFYKTPFRSKSSRTIFYHKIFLKIQFLDVID
jgi:hypothetical protein